jgi:dolichol-phosphate mannosyltransferase
MQERSPATPRLSLVIPAYNEEAGIAKAIAEADEALRELQCSYEIIVVDDGSQDQTICRANEAAAQRPQVRVVRHDRNQGYGAALRTGFEAAQGVLVAFTDADCQFDLADLRRLIPLTETTPVAVGYRVDRQDPWRRRFLSRCYNFLVRRLLGTRVRDVDCALKIFRRDALHHLLPTSTNFFVNSEMLTRARQAGLEVLQVGVRHRPRRHGHSKVSWGDVPRTLRTLLPFWWTQVMFPHPPTHPRLAGHLGNQWVLVAVLILVLLSRFAGTTDVSWFSKPPASVSDINDSGTTFTLAQFAGLFRALLLLLVAASWAAALTGPRIAWLSVFLLALSPIIHFEAPLARLALITNLTMGLLHLALTRSRHSIAFWSAAWLCCSLETGLSGPMILGMILPPVVILLLLDHRLRRPTRIEWLLAGMCLMTGGVLHFVTTNAYNQLFEFRWNADHSSHWYLAFWLGLVVLLAYDLLHHGAWRRRFAEQGVFIMFALWSLCVGWVAGRDQEWSVAFVPVSLALACTAEMWLRTGGRWLTASGYAKSMREPTIHQGGSR